MVVNKSLRDLFILNTIILGFMFMLVILLAIVLRLPATVEETVLVAITILDLAVMLYKSGNSLDEYSKYFEGLGTGITGCILSALGVVTLTRFVTLEGYDFYIYVAIFAYTMIVGALYIVLNELHRKKRTGK